MACEKNEREKEVSTMTSKVVEKSNQNCHFLPEKFKLSASPIKNGGPLIGEVT